MYHVACIILGIPVVGDFLEGRVRPDERRKILVGGTALVDPAAVEDDPGIGAGIGSEEARTSRAKNLRQVPDAVLTILRKVEKVLAFRESPPRVGDGLEGSVNSLPRASRAGVDQAVSHGLGTGRTSSIATRNPKDGCRECRMSYLLGSVPSVVENAGATFRFVTMLTTG